MATIKIKGIRVPEKKNRDGSNNFKGMHNVLNYICNDEKCLSSISIDDINKDESINDLLNLVQNETEMEKGINNVLTYISNENKIKKKYISGYMCYPDMAYEEFLNVDAQHLAKQGKTIDDIDGNFIYHIIQSFPEELDISDDEIHQCGLELVQKLEKYQAVVASHLHEEINEDGEVKGKCKHNHIMINAYMHPDFVDPQHPNQLKYNDCKETYRQLQIMNDEISLAHGLPIIDSPDFNKTYSWYENEQINKGKSWKERVRLDLDNGKRMCSNWDGLLTHLKDMGYEIQEGKHVTYTTPNGHKIRDYKLGIDYVKEQINAYFIFKQQLMDDIVTDKKKEDIYLDEILKEANGERLFIRVEKNKSGKFAKKNKLTNQTYDLMIPLNQTLREDSFQSYFTYSKIYEVCDENKNIITQITGKQILEYFQEKLNQQSQENDKVLQDNLKELDNQNYQYDSKNRTFYNTQWIRVTTKKPLSIYSYDRFGRRRGVLELVLLLAIAFLKTEGLNWLDPQTNYSNVFKDGVLYAKRDWKIQNLIDAIEEVNKNNILTMTELNQKLNTAGIKVATLKRKVKSLSSTLNNMTNIKEAIDDYEKIKVVNDQLLQMKPSLEKEKLSAKQKANSEKFKAASATLYKTNTMNLTERQQFLDRYNDIKNQLTLYEKELQEANENYRQLKKAAYHLQLAQNEKYTCGLTYSYDKAMHQTKFNTLSEDEISEKLEHQQANEKDKEKNR